MLYPDFQMLAAFQTLGLYHTCTKDEVKKAYRQKMLENHPDKSTYHEGYNGEAEAKLCNAAYNLIKEHWNFEDYISQPTSSSRTSACPVFQPSDDYITTLEEIRRKDEEWCSIKRKQHEKFETRTSYAKKRK